MVPLAVESTKQPWQWKIASSFGEQSENRRPCIATGSTAGYIQMGCPPKKLRVDRHFPAPIFRQPGMATLTGWWLGQTQ